MELVKKESVLEKYKNTEELPEAYALLLQKAKQAVNSSYAPYSKFNVGCAILLDNGEILCGSNQENIAYPSGLCAERVAVFYAGAHYPHVKINMMAITVKAQNYVVDKPIMSCGACLQSISEYETRFSSNIKMILQGETGDIYVASGTETFMPFKFYVKELSD